MASSFPADHPNRSVTPVTQGLLEQLTNELNKQSQKTTFTCSGTIPIRVNRTTNADDHQHQYQGAASAPVTIRWDPQAVDGPASETKLTLPLEPTTKDNLDKLVRDMQPASFGFQGKDVLDETYRKALKMDTERFASTFNPYELGIIDTICQVLLPSVPGADIHRGVKAELYKLNVSYPPHPTNKRISSTDFLRGQQLYSSPSGKFKPHIDTPRGQTQFGSLVVCLPLEHKGGELQVRHKGLETTYEWGSALDRISWAAFYSDCEHEVLEVTSGHRLTLTYNLYGIRSIGPTGNLATCALDVLQMPLYQSLKEMIENKDFLRDGECRCLYFCLPQS